MGSACTKQPIIRKPSRKISEYSKVINLKNQYQYIKALGNGAYGKVRLYRNSIYKDMHYAIKTLKTEYISSSQHKCLINEVNILRGLDHPNIVKYYETIEDDSYIHIVMEYLEGEDLHKVYLTKELNEASLCIIIKQLLKALVFLHNKNIIHRDIKPENILFGKQGDYSNLKLIDFGLSTASKQNDGKTVGSPFYMSPESILGNIEPKSDLWSVGVILYHLLTGDYPFPKEGNIKVLFYNIQNKPYDKEALQYRNCSKEVIDLLDKLLNKSIRKRLSAQDALKHPWFNKCSDNNNNGNSSSNVNNEINCSNNTFFTKETIDLLKRFNNKLTLQKEILFFIARISRDDEIRQLTKVFNSINKSNIGVLNKDEIKQAFMHNGIRLSNDDLNVVWDSLNFHNNANGVYYTEFITAMISEWTIQKEDKLFSAFKYFENQEDEGYVTCDSLILSAKAFNISLNEQSIRRNFKKDKLDYEAFKAMLGLGLSQGRSINTPVLKG